MDCLFSTSSIRCCNICSRKHNRHHAVIIRKDIIICIAYWINAITLPTCMVPLYCMGTTVNNKYGYSVHDQHHSRHHKSHTSVDKQVCLCQILGLLPQNDLPHVLSRAECTDNRNTCQNLTGYQIQSFDQSL